MPVYHLDETFDMMMFALKGHPKAGLACAGGHAIDRGGRRYVAGLGAADQEPPAYASIATDHVKK